MGWLPYGRFHGVNAQYNEIRGSFLGKSSPSRRIYSVTRRDEKPSMRGISLFVKSYSSAHKGCLDIRHRRRTWQAAISRGELPHKLWTVDVRMGKPHASHVAWLVLRTRNFKHQTSNFR